jgi:hypothetical protein
MSEEPISTGGNQVLTKLTILTLLAAALLVIPVAAQAQPQATLILASGEHVRGQLIDMNASDFTMKVRNDERQVAVNSVAVVDFVGSANIPSSETSKIQAGRTLVCMRGGECWYGQLYDMSERDPLRITFRTQDGDRDVHSNEVARIYLRQWKGMPSGGAQPSSPAGGGITVPGNQSWVNTGIQVRRGQMISFRASGQIQLSDNADDKTGAAGTDRSAPRGAPLPGQPAGALVGRVGNGAPFRIGDQTQPIAMPAAGMLFVGVNDDFVKDNRGEFRVEITVSQ